MKTIIVGFSRPKKWKILSYLIQKGQKTNYSHVYVKYHSDSLERDIIYQASGLQVNFIGNSLFSNKRIIIKEFELSIDDKLYKKVLQFSVDGAGKPYSISQLFNILIYQITGKELLNNGRNSYVCSELVGQILSQELGFDITKNLDIITPKDIYNILDKKYGED